MDSGKTILPSNEDDVRFSSMPDSAQDAPARWTDTSAALADLTPDDPPGGFLGWLEMLVDVTLRLVGEVLGSIAQIR
jgi:hypothetical protein